MKGDRFTKRISLISKASLIAGSVMLLGAACWKGVGTNTNVGLANGNVGVNENVNTLAGNVNAEVNVNVSANTNTNTNSTGEVDTSGWLTYTNEEYGFSFRYPEDWVIKEEELTDFSNALEYDPDNFAGKSKRFTIKSLEKIGGDITLMLNTSDIKNMYSTYSAGGDLNKYCPNPGKIESNSSYCEIVEINGREFLYRNQFVNTECSPRFTTSILMNNPNTKTFFNGLEFSAALNDIQKDLFSEPFKDNDVCSGNIDIDSKLQNYLKNGFFKNNLSTPDKDMFEVMKGMAQSIQSL